MIDEREHMADLLYEAQYRHMSVEETVDLLQDHGVIWPPCKVGDYVFTIEHWFKGEYSPRVVGHRVTSITMDECNCGEMTIEAESHFGYFVEKDFGKTVFCTREEADKVLKERESNKPAVDKSQ